MIKVMRMKKMTVIAAMVFAATFVFAQNNEMVKVRGRGVGTNKTEALKDAYRDAIERAVGLYVDAEQMLKNEELVKDQILTQSNAYIEQYEVAKETTKPNGLVEILILAEVRKVALKKKLTEMMPPRSYGLSDGLKNAHAKITTVEKRDVDGATLLAKTLEGFDPHILSIDCSLASNEPVMAKKKSNWPPIPSDSIAVNYRFRIEVNRRRYSENVVSKLQPVLEQISLTKPQTIAISSTKGESGGNYFVHKSNFDMAGFHCSSIKRFDWDAILRKPQARENVNFFVLVTGGNKFDTVFNGIVYELDNSAYEVVQRWERYFHSYERFCCIPKFAVSLLDKDGTMIVRDTMALGVRCSLVTGLNYNGRKITVMAPWFDPVHGNLFLDCYSLHKFIIPKDALPEVKDLKIEIVK